MVFPVVMYGCESWIIKKLSTKELMLFNCSVGENSWSPLDCKIKPVNSKGNQSWIFIERTGAETEAPVLWPPDVKTWLTGKDPDAGKDWGRREKGMTEDEMVGWHHQLSRHGFEQTAGAGDGQGGLVRCSPWGLRESHTLSDWTELIYYIKLCAGHWNGKKYRTWTCFTRAFVV